MSRKKSKKTVDIRYAKVVYSNNVEQKKKSSEKTFKKKLKKC